MSLPAKQPMDLSLGWSYDLGSVAGSKGRRKWQSECLIQVWAG
ncbi:hypothetical protein SAMN04488238_10912 [Roseicitreum antarcticum]|uniref:Uncharacterized protein n=1 Tax=Roseicitreum antarcticum TaxID=564137 RepID=A0A1H3C483_9RHOB|nr:hypothetical protein SAMN04488238_10912 [Roseicitreum antarcticum]